ncbi:hypothetical protein [Staphylospora marina]|uniref:hypothetical protein n=1 Tax=Staphylospora marina TaxID=2490858 RepID=UPI000F5BD6CB|nr:hypothetical protein [Staphylospora marina]
MDFKQNILAGWYRVKEFLPRFGKSEKGSPTMEYVIIIAVGAVFATILYNIFKNDKSGIKTELTNKVKESISGESGDGGDDKGGDNKGGDNKGGDNKGGGAKPQ